MAASARLAYDEVFANQLALLLIRASSRRRRGVPLQGDGRLIKCIGLRLDQRQIVERVGDEHALAIASRVAHDLRAGAQDHDLVDERLHDPSRPQNWRNGR